MSSNLVGGQSVKSQEGLVGRIRSYNEIVEFLNSRRQVDHNELTIQRMHKLDEIFDNISSKLDVILVGGSNGKSSTINFSSKLLREEGFRVGTAYSSHFLTYNERISIDSQNINNKQFSEITNEVINAVEQHKIDATTFEIATIASLLFFEKEKVDVALFEVAIGGLFDATNIMNPKISAITRVVEDSVDILGSDIDKITKDVVGIAKKGSWFISAEQSKIRLQKMKDFAEEKEAKWVMPIRKLATLPYIFEQLYGKSASLAERITQIYVEDVIGKFSPFLRGNLLATTRGQRGRPTLEAKREAELNPIKTLKSFWSEEFNLLRGRFEILDKEKPTILLDNAKNIEALENLFLGIRLLHYQRPINGLALIIGLKDFVQAGNVAKHIRYLFKRVGGQVFFVPIKGDANYLSTDNLVEAAKDLGVKAKACKTFEEAFSSAAKIVDERQGLLCISGHPSLISQYWKEKDIKKFS
ncbi:hypothetical protein KAW80_04565 [Candidatus Babeliales bacterium]|nr:hypothetical protein [Candidatus Babeliales bacterium]